MSPAVGTSTARTPMLSGKMKRENKPLAPALGNIPGRPLWGARPPPRWSTTAAAVSSIIATEIHLLTSQSVFFQPVAALLQLKGNSKRASAASSRIKPLLANRKERVEQLELRLEQEEKENKSRPSPDSKSPRKEKGQGVVPTGSSSSSEQEPGTTKADVVDKKSSILESTRTTTQQDAPEGLPPIAKRSVSLLQSRRKPPSDFSRNKHEEDHYPVQEQKVDTNNNAMENINTKCDEVEPQDDDNDDDISFGKEDVSLLEKRRAARRANDGALAMEELSFPPTTSFFQIGEVKRGSKSRLKVPAKDKRAVADQNEDALNNADSSSRTTVTSGSILEILNKKKRRITVTTTRLAESSTREGRILAAAKEGTSKKAALASTNAPVPARNQPNQSNDVVFSFEGGGGPPSGNDVKTPSILSASSKRTSVEDKNSATWSSGERSTSISANKATGRTRRRSTPSTTSEDENAHQPGSGASSPGRYQDDVVSEDGAYAYPEPPPPKISSIMFAAPPVTEEEQHQPASSSSSPGYGIHESDSPKIKININIPTSDGKNTEDTSNTNTLPSASVPLEVEAPGTSSNGTDASLAPDGASDGSSSSGSSELMDDEEDSSILGIIKRLTTGQIIAIIAAASFLLLVLALCCYLKCCRKKSDNKSVKLVKTPSGNFIVDESGLDQGDTEGHRASGVNTGNKPATRKSGDPDEGTALPHDGKHHKHPKGSTPQQQHLVGGQHQAGSTPMKGAGKHIQGSLPPLAHGGSSQLSNPQSLLQGMLHGAQGAEVVAVAAPAGLAQPSNEIYHGQSPSQNAFLMGTGAAPGPVSKFGRAMSRELKYGLDHAKDIPKSQEINEDDYAKKIALNRQKYFANLTHDSRFNLEENQTAEEKIAILNAYYAETDLGSGVSDTSAEQSEDALTAPANKQGHKKKKAMKNIAATGPGSKRKKIFKDVGEIVTALEVKWRDLVDLEKRKLLAYMINDPTLPGTLEIPAELFDRLVEVPFALPTLGEVRHVVKEWKRIGVKKAEKRESTGSPETYFHLKQKKTHSDNSGDGSDSSDSDVSDSDYSEEDPENATPKSHYKNRIKSKSLQFKYKRAVIDSGFTPVFESDLRIALSFGKITDFIVKPENVIDVSLLKCYGIDLNSDRLGAVIVWARRRRKELRDVERGLLDAELVDGFDLVNQVEQLYPTEPDQQEMVWKKCVLEKTLGQQETADILIHMSPFSEEYSKELAHKLCVEENPANYELEKRVKAQVIHKSQQALSANKTTFELDNKHEHHHTFVDPLAQDTLAPPNEEEAEKLHALGFAPRENLKRMKGWTHALYLQAKIDWITQQRSKKLGTQLSQG